MKDCAICTVGFTPEDARQRHCGNCRDFDGDAYEAVARLRKVVALSKALRDNGVTAMDAAALNEAGWKLAAAVAGCNPPNSDATKVMAIYALGHGVTVI